MQDVINEVSTTTSGRGDLGNQYKVLDTIIEDSLKGVAYNAKYGGYDVQIQDTENTDFNIYLCKELGSTTLAVASAINDRSVTVTSATGALVGDCIDIIEGHHFFQSIIKTVVGNVITFASPLDNSFTTSAMVHFGEWNLATANGSVTPQIFSVSPPPDANYHITAISFTMTDEGTMDDSKFGSLTALTNGIVARRVDGTIANYFLISNNAGFFQYGYDTTYPDKVPAGIYSFRARKLLKEINGTIIALNGDTADELQIIVQDNLTSLSEFTVTIHGHVVEN